MKIISGGQSGADRGGLEAAKELGIETGGYAPLHFLTEYGNDPTLKEFGLVDSGKGYPERTELNVKAADVTLWFGRSDSAGYKATHRACITNGKPFIVADNFFIVDIKYLISEAHVINIAGNRESLAPGTRVRVKEQVKLILQLML